MIFLEENLSLTSVSIGADILAASSSVENFIVYKASNDYNDFVYDT